MMDGIMTKNAPSHWTMYRLGQLFQERKEKGSDTEFLPLSVTKKGIVPQLETAAKTDDGENRKIIRAGDFVINSRSDRKGSGGLSDRDGSTSQISIVLQPRNIFPRFAHHLLKSSAFQEEFYMWGHGIVADLWTTRFRDMKNIRLSIPKVEEQRKIADFLDRETAHIELLIDSKLNIIERRQERLSAQIQTEFDVLEAPLWRLRHVCRLRNGAGFPEHLQGEPDNEIPFFKVKHLATNGLGCRLLSSDDTISRETADTLRATVFPKGTIVFAKIGAALMLARFARLGVEACIDNNCAALIPAANIDADYLLLALERSEMAAMVQPGAVPSLNTWNFLNQKIALPSRAEQKHFIERVRIIKENAASICTAILGSIELLQEYRAALITASVTGQIDVNEYKRSGSVDRHLDTLQQEHQT